MDIKQLILAAAGCLSYLARATPTPSSTAVANRSSDTELQPTPEGRLSSFDVTARHIPPYMQKIIEETFLARERQQAKEASVHSSYEDVDLQVGGESLFRERRQAGPALSYLVTNSSDTIFRARTVFNGDVLPNYLAGLGLQVFDSSDRSILRELDERFVNQSSICRSPIAMRGYTTQLNRYAGSPASYIGCTPDGRSLYCRSDLGNCVQLTWFQPISIATQYLSGDFNTTNIPFAPTNSSVLVMPLLEAGHEIISYGDIYNVSGVSTLIRGNAYAFSWSLPGFTSNGDSNYRKSITAFYLNDLCSHVKFKCSPSIDRTTTLAPVSTSSVPSSSSVASTSSFNELPGCVPPSTVFLTPSPSNRVLTEDQEAPQWLKTNAITAGAVGAASGGIFVLAVAGMIKLLSNKLKKGEVEITLPRPPVVSEPVHETEEIYSVVGEHTTSVRLENYPPLPGNGVPPSRALLNRSYGRIRTVSETSSNLTTCTLSTDSTDAPPETITEEYIEMGSIGTPAIYNVPPPTNAIYAKPSGQEVSSV